MLPQPPTPEPPRPRRGGRLFTIWLIALITIIGDEQLSRVARRVGISTAPLSVLTFFACLVLIALTLYGFTVAVRWTLRRLFWRVGRRLFLSYVLIGMLPFFLFAILLLSIGYIISGVISHAAQRGA